MKQILKVSDRISFGDNLAEIAYRYSRFPNAVIEVNVENYGDDIDLCIEYEREETDDECVIRERKEQAKEVAKAKRAATMLAKRVAAAAPTMSERSFRKTYMDWIREKNLHIYSTATLAGEVHRISIPWGEGRNISMKKAMRLNPTATRRAEDLIKWMEIDFPVLKGLVEFQFHVGSCLYLSLRISPRKG